MDTWSYSLLFLKLSVPSCYYTSYATSYIARYFTCAWLAIYTVCNVYSMYNYLLPV